MYNFQTTKNYESKTLPGVVVKLRKMTENRRHELQLLVASPNQRIRELVAKQRQLASQDTAEATLEILSLSDQIDLIATKELNPAKLKWGIKSISGLMLDDEPATMENVMDWPSDLIKELLDLIDDGSALNEVEQKNSESPTTSGAQTVRATQNSSAPNASEETTDSSSAETVEKNFLN